MTTGRCLCGDIKFSTEGEPIFVAHCHCESCRRQTGSLPASFVGFATEQVSYTKDPQEYESSPDVYRAFCANCGSAMHYRTDGETHLYLGVFNDPGQYRATRHVFFDEHIEGYDLHDNLARFGANHRLPMAWGKAATNNILFLCTGNSARSILAEAITNGMGLPGIRAFSAGSSPNGQVNPGAIELLNEIGLNDGQLRSKSWDEFTAADAPSFRWVITLCDNAANEVCPVFPGAHETLHWGLPDPAAGEISFQQAFDEIKVRVQNHFSVERTRLDR